MSRYAGTLHPRQVGRARGESTGATTGRTATYPRATGRERTFRALIDGEAPGPSGSVDVDEEGHGVLREGRMYQLVRGHDAVRHQTLEITFLEPGTEAYAFTFG